MLYNIIYEGETWVYWLKICQKLSFLGTFLSLMCFYKLLNTELQNKSCVQPKPSQQPSIHGSFKVWKCPSLRTWIFLTGSQDTRLGRTYVKHQTLMVSCKPNLRKHVSIINCNFGKTSIVAFIDLLVLLANQWDNVFLDWSFVSSFLPYHIQGECRNIHHEVSSQWSSWKLYIFLDEKQLVLIWFLLSCDVKSIF